VYLFLNRLKFGNENLPNYQTKIENTEKIKYGYIIKSEYSRSLNLSRIFKTSLYHLILSSFQKCQSFKLKHILNN